MILVQCCILWHLCLKCWQFTKVPLLQKKKSLWRVTAESIILFEELVSAQAVVSIDTNWSEQKCVKEFSGNNSKRESAEANILKLGRTLYHVKSKRSALAVLRALHPHWAWRKCTHSRQEMHIHTHCWDTSQHVLFNRLLWNATDFRSFVAHFWLINSWLSVLCRGITKTSSLGEVRMLHCRFSVLFFCSLLTPLL